MMMVLSPSKYSPGNNRQEKGEKEKQLQSTDRKRGEKEKSEQRNKRK